jgi:hypothetical protein
MPLIALKSQPEIFSESQKHVSSVRVHEVHVQLTSAPLSEDSPFAGDFWLAETLGQKYGLDMACVLPFHQQKSRVRPHGVAAGFAPLLPAQSKSIGG